MKKCFFLLVLFVLCVSGIDAQSIATASVTAPRTVQDGENQELVQRVKIGRYDRHKHLLQVFVEGTGIWDKELKFALDDGPVKVVKSEDHIAGDSQVVQEYRLSCFLDNWDELHPNVYELTAVARKDTLRTVFGIRDVSARGGQCYINGRVMAFHRMKPDESIPLSAYLSSDVDVWFNILKYLKETGVNVLCFQDRIPPESAFTAADCLGFYLEIGSPALLNRSEQVGMRLSENRQMLDNTKLLVDHFGNHPSFVMMLADRTAFDPSVLKGDSWMKAMRQYDSGRIYGYEAENHALAWEPSSSVEDVRTAERPVVLQ